MTQPKALQNVIKKKDTGKSVGLNIPAMARGDERLMKTLVAPDGHEFVGRDVKSLEPSVTAEFSRDPMYTYATQTGVGKKPYWDDRLNILMVDDIYQMYGSKTSFMGQAYKSAWVNNDFFNLWMEDSDAVKESELIKPHRKFSKVIVLGVERGMGARKLKDQAKEKAQKDISLQIARTAIKEFWEIFEGVKALKDKLSHIATVHGAFTTPLGFRVPCDDYKAYPFFTQAVGNDVIMLYREYYMELAPWSHPITPIHDELVTWRPIDKREQDQAAHQEALNRVNETLKWDTPIRMTESYGKTFWSLK